VDKHKFKDKFMDKVLVGFELPPTASATTVSVCGDFNGWQAEAHPLTRLGDGRFRTEIALPAGERYRFRYLVDGRDWENDPAADDYLPNGLGADDCVVDLTDIRSLPFADAAGVTDAASARFPQESPPAPSRIAGLHDVSQPPAHPGLQRIQIRPETWQRIETQAAARGIEPQDLIAYVIEVAMSSEGQLATGG
jgi:hypothetical protein